MKGQLLVILALGLCVITCNPQFPTESNAHVDFEPFDDPTVPLLPFAREAMEGIYSVVQGQDVLGQTVVGKWVEQPWCMRWSIYAQHDVVFCETAGGSTNEGSIRLLGYLRTVRAGSSVGIKLVIHSNEGASDLLSGTPTTSIIVRGKTDDGTQIELHRIRSIGAQPYIILGHQGGGRNSDRLGYSENSIPMIRHAAIFGATGIEIDVKRTRDNKIIVFHDDTFSPRTVQGIYLLGPVEDYDLQQIQSLGKLINGETIPTLADALTSVVDDTNLQYVWIDVKDPAEVDLVIPIQMAALAHAAVDRRDSLRIFMGIPSEDVLKAYRASTYYNQSDVLTELGADVVRTLRTCRAWAQYWTEGISGNEIQHMRSDSIKVFVWTVDLREKIIENLGKVDGILTNYSSMVRGIHDAE